MSTNWKSLVEKTNAKTYVLPDGWDSRESIADQLGCSPEKVNDHLRPGLNAGEIEKQQFPVWSSALNRKVMVWAYRRVQAKETQAPSSKPTLKQITALKKAGKTWNEIGAQFNMTGENVRSIWRNK
jgi:DNA-binding CsgD family transcriptional regulator